MRLVAGKQVLVRCCPLTESFWWELFSFENAEKARGQGRMTHMYFSTYWHDFSQFSGNPASNNDSSSNHFVYMIAHNVSNSILTRFEPVFQGKQLAEVTCPFWDMQDGGCAVRRYFWRERYRPWRQEIWQRWVIHDYKECRQWYCLKDLFWNVL